IVELAEQLRATLPPELDAVIVVNSGSEANDLAWRIARAATGRAGAIVTNFAYHGLTEATHALSPEERANGQRPAHVPTIPPPAPREAGPAVCTGGNRTGGRSSTPPTSTTPPARSAPVASPPSIWTQPSQLTASWCLPPSTSRRRPGRHRRWAGSWWPTKSKP